MTKSMALACSALALGIGLISMPAAQAMDNDGMSKMSGSSMHKDSMKKHKKHKDGMMSHDAMKGDAMQKDGAAPAQ